MKINKRLLISLFIGIAIFINLSLVSIWAIPFSINNELSDEEYPLSNTVRLGIDDPILAISPDFPGANDIINRFNEYSPAVTKERFYKIKLTQEYSDTQSLKGLFLKIINAFGNPETIVGYTYFSSTRDKDIVMFEKSYISDKRGKQIEGFSFNIDNLPGEINYYQYVDEANFSGTVSKQKIIVDDNFLSYQSINIKSIWYYFIPVMKKGGTRNEVLFFVSDQYLYIYNCTQLLKEPAITNLGFPIHLPSMFRKRMDVMVRWLEDQLNLSNLGK
jgi:hypothetical protein